MKQTWRWFGPADKVSLQDVRQAGATVIVTALHEIPNGAIWSRKAIEERQALIRGGSNGAATGLTWDVVESLPVTEDIKRQTGDWKSHVASYKMSLENLAACGIETVCYNFMPVLDWTRTDLRYELPDGARCMRFDVFDFAVFDIFLLQRNGAEEDFNRDVVNEARIRHSQMSEDDKTNLVSNVICGLPGAEEGYSLSSLQDQLDLYEDIDADRLRQHQVDFLSEVIPVAEKLGIRMCCHPDDPPFPLLGLPRIMSTEEDYTALVTAIDSPSNGITLCSGSLGVRESNNLTGMVERLGSKIHFAHLRNVRRETDVIPNSFHEAAHLEGSSDMVSLVAALLNEEKRRKDQGRADCNIPFRPDHGQDILSDLQSDAQPGYSAIGRLKGLAELRGIIAAQSFTTSV